MFSCFGLESAPHNFTFYVLSDDKTSTHVKISNSKEPVSLKQVNNTKIVASTSRKSIFGRQSTLVKNESNYSLDQVLYCSKFNTNLRLQGLLIKDFLIDPSIRRNIVSMTVDKFEEHEQKIISQILQKCEIDNLILIMVFENRDGEEMIIEEFRTNHPDTLIVTSEIEFELIYRTLKSLDIRKNLNIGGFM